MGRLARGLIRQQPQGGAGNIVCSFYVGDGARRVEPAIDLAEVVPARSTHDGASEPDRFDRVLAASPDESTSHKNKIRLGINLRKDSHLINHKNGNIPSFRRLVRPQGKPDLIGF